MPERFILNHPAVHETEFPLPNRFNRNLILHVPRLVENILQIRVKLSNRELSPTYFRDVDNLFILEIDLKIFRNHF